MKPALLLCCSRPNSHQVTHVLLVYQVFSVHAISVCCFEATLRQVEGWIVFHMYRSAPIPHVHDLHFAQLLRVGVQDSARSAQFEAAAVDSKLAEENIQNRK